MIKIKITNYQIKFKDFSNFTDNKYSLRGSNIINMLNFTATQIDHFIVLLILLILYCIILFSDFIYIHFMFSTSVLIGVIYILQWLIYCVLKRGVQLWNNCRET